jgi:translocation and assembly module TamB
VVQAPGLGQRFSDIDARVALTGDELRLESLEAHGTTGRLTARGSAHLEGFDVRSAQGRVDIQKREALPITYEGAAMGDAWGTVEAKYQSSASQRELTIELPVLHLVMPESSGQNLQSLDPPKDVRVGVRQADGRFTVLPVQPLESEDDAPKPGTAGPPLRTVIRLGRDVTVERGRSAQVQLSGQLAIVSQAHTEVDGRIEVRGGKLDVSGKIFEIERGVATFEGDDAGNPTITATARWDAPEYSVYAEYAGDLTTGRLKLHSEPPLSQNEIANLLMFGNPEGPAAGSANTAALAVSVAGSTAVQGLNRVLDDFTQLQVSARIDTTSGSARPELVFQVSPRVSARVTRAIGAPAAGESPDRTFLTLELRLKRAWALSAVFGDHGGSALDVIWRHRY